MAGAASGQAGCVGQPAARGWQLFPYENHNCVRDPAGPRSCPLRPHPDHRPRVEVALRYFLEGTRRYRLGCCNWDNYALLRLNVTCSFTQRSLFSPASPRPGRVGRGKLPAPACPAAARRHLPARPPPQSAPVGRQPAALAEGIPPSAGRSPPRRPPAPPRRTPGGGRRSGTAGFRSPIPSPRSCQPNGASEEALQHEIEELKRKDLALDQEIAQLLSEGYSLEELEKHISLLHEYNDIKDAGQMLLGKLAVIRGVTTKQLYPEYDLELSD
ncbi:DNA repair protein SWI5 homolog [Chlamydotis macqueenii]